MPIKRVLWLEDEYEDYRTFIGALYRANYVVDNLKSVSEVEEKLNDEQYIALIFDIKVLPGHNQKWIEFDRKKRAHNPEFDSYLGLELLFSLFAPNKATVKLEQPIKIDPKKVIIFSVVYSLNKEFLALGIPEENIINKSDAKLDTLPRLVRRIEENG